MFDRRNLVLNAMYLVSLGAGVSVGARVLAGSAIVPSDLKAIVTIGGR